MTHYSVQLLLYNRDLFEAAGVPLPTADWTWADFERAAIRISADKNGDGLLDQFGCYMPVSDYATVSSFVWQNGASPWSTTGTLGLNSSPAREAIRFLLDLSAKKAQPSISQMQTSEIGELFKSGRLGFMYTWPSGILEYTKGLPFKYGVAPIAHGKQRATYGGGPAYAISRGSRHPREAWEFMKFLLGSEVQLEMARAGLVMPSIRLPREQLLAVFPYPDVIDAYEASLPYAQSMPRLRNQNRIVTQFAQNMDDILYGVRSIDEGTEEFHSALLARTKPKIRRRN
jgi:multiple sugar transport system substrate-binding protein